MRSTTTADPARRLQAAYPGHTNSREKRRGTLLRQSSYVGQIIGTLRQRPQNSPKFVAGNNYSANTTSISIIGDEM